MEEYNITSNVFIYFTSGSITRFWQPKTNTACLIRVNLAHYLAADYNEDYLIDDSTGSYASEVIHGVIEGISEKLPSKYSIRFLPTADKDIVQKLGKSNRSFIIKGLLTSYQYGFCYNEGDTCNDSDSGFFRDMIGYTGSIIFNNAFGDSDILTGGQQVAYSSTTVVLWTGVDFEDKSGRPMERRFTLSAVEI